MFGFRWLQRIRLPFGFRSTVSRSGVGYSWGVPGLRIGVSPTGRKWISFGFPGIGLSFFRYLGRGNSQRDAVFIDDDEVVEFSNVNSERTINDNQQNQNNSHVRNNSNSESKISKWKNLK